ncbi:hypothetical protein [Methylocella sp.]|uniref:hypothetical protein n=1 Tax=Methylocella sp. TaxID=1978226 RepID=UPI0035AE1715
MKGMRDDAAPGRAFEAVRVEGAGVFAADAGFAYRVVDAPGGRRQERRARPRRRTRLRSGKLLDAGNGFLADCLIYDESELGARVRVLAAPPRACAYRLYQDRPERLVEARLAWRSDRELGLAFPPPAAPLRIGALDLTALREGRYAVRD